MTNVIEREGINQRPLCCVPAGELPEYYAGMGKELELFSASPKARVERLLVEGAGFFPDRLVIPRAIVPAEDAGALQSYMDEGIMGRYVMGVRAVSDRPLFGGAKLAWAIGIDSSDKARDFLALTLPGWHQHAARDNYRISHLILMKNPPELGTLEERPGQFVLRARWNSFAESYSPHSQFLMEMAIGTNRLRSLDRRMEQGNGTIIRFRSRFSPGRVPRNAELDIGSWYLCSEGGGDECHELKGPAGPLNLKNVDGKYAGVIHTVLGRISALITDPDVEFLKRIDFLSDIGYDTVEFQGVTGARPVDTRLFVYGLRGSRDETQTGLDTLINHPDRGD